MRRYLFLLYLICFFCGCATTKPPVDQFFIPAPKPENNQGVLYIFEAPPAFLVPDTPTIAINGKTFVRLSRFGYSYIYLNPGVYRLSIIGGEGFMTEIEIKPGQELFEEYYNYGAGNGINELSKERALEKLEHFKYIQPAILTNKDPG